ncbi:hypothetical protein F4604DRAFT_1909228 [Suillus subluteus]|nr:hypothetical protein F4604DRAFT_1909228 [Suillus subluteus]
MSALNGYDVLYSHAISPPHTLDPAEERENGDLLNFEGGDQAIADKVRHEIAVANGEVVEIHSDDKSDGPSFTPTELLDLCQQLETGCMQHGDPQLSLNLSSQLRLFRARLRREELLNAKQTSIDCVVDTVLFDVTTLAEVTYVTRWESGIPPTSLWQTNAGDSDLGDTVHEKLNETIGRCKVHIRPARGIRIVGDLWDLAVGDDLKWNSFVAVADVSLMLRFIWLTEEG